MSEILSDKELPEDWKVATLDDVAYINPRVDKSEIEAELCVSFVPMPAVGAGTSGPASLLSWLILSIISSILL